MMAPATDAVIGRSLAVYGEWAQLEIDLLAHFLKEGDTALDVGACFGTHSLAFGDLVGTSGRVIAFEASPTNFSLLNRNCAASRGGPIQTVQAVVAAGVGGRFVSGEVEQNYGASSVKAASGTADEGESRSLSIDSLALARADFIKIDVEGTESDVVAGALETIRRCRPIIFFEVNFVQEAVNVLNKLKNSDYVFFGSVQPAFNPSNFLGNPTDIFHGGAECGVLAMPMSRNEAFHHAIRVAQMAAIETADDIALLLMNKPQYVGMDITRERAARSLKVPAVLTTVGSVGILSRELAEAKAQGETAQRELDRRRDEGATALRQINRQRVELDRQKDVLDRQSDELDQQRDELDRQRDEIDRLGPLADMGRVLARRAGKFPFSAYFRVKRKYRVILRALRTGVIDPGPTGLPPPRLGPPGLRPPRLGPQSTVAQAEPHPGGFKAESLMQLRPIVLPETVNAEGLRFGEETILTAEAIHQALAGLAACRGVIVSFSHDHYTTIVGGSQKCVGIEEREGRAEGFVYLHAHPLAYLQSLAPANVAGMTFLRLTLNGVVLGVCSYVSLRDAVTRLREDGMEQYVVVHHLLGHAVEPISEVIQATGRRRCWLWLHDFFTVCVSPHLLRNGVSFCSAPRSDSAACGICAFGTARLTHQKRMRSFFEANEVQLIAPSEFVADLWRDKADLPYADIRIVPHLELEVTPELDLEVTPELQSAEQSSRPARVAFIGVPALHKGWPHFAKLVNEYRDNKDYDFLYFGVHKVDLDIPHFSVSVSKDNQTGMIDALRETGVDIVLHISPTPETFSFTTYEALASGAFVVTNADSGNTARVIAKTGRGLVLEHENDIGAAFAKGDILRLAKEARARRATESCKVGFSRLTIPFLIAESK